jgi:hypothetical protein
MATVNPAAWDGRYVQQVTLGAVHYGISLGGW